jgi:uncharacterized protein
MILLLYILVGLVIGIVGGMVGIGGGVLLIPTLTLGFGLDLRKAVALSLAILAPPVTLPGVWHYYKAGLIGKQDIALVAVVSLAFAVGAYLGARHQSQVDQSTLKLLFGSILLYVAVRTLLDASGEAKAATFALFSLPFAWICFLALRAFGRKQRRPHLRERIREHPEEPPPSNDYYI